MMCMRIEFIDAEMEMFGFTKKYAAEEYKRLQEKGDLALVESIVEMWESQCKKSFYED